MYVLPGTHARNIYIYIYNLQRYSKTPKRGQYPAYVCHQTLSLRPQCPKLY
jgi:hypothetical protein